MTDLLSGGKVVWDLVRGLISSYEREREDLFIKHVDPLQTRILAIHKDYVTGLEDVRIRLLNAEMSIDDILEFLSIRRRSFLAERNLAKHVAEKLRAAERRPVRGEAWAALSDYCEAIGAYLSRPYEFESRSVFTHLLRETRKASEIDFSRTLFDPEELRQIDHWERTGQIDRWEEVRKGTLPIQGPAPRDLLRFRIEGMLDDMLPSAMNDINSAYSRLRVHLT